nr:MAG TPA: hypothetical protein [Caudoviricetes sp.]
MRCPFSIPGIGKYKTVYLLHFLIAKFFNFK